MQVLTGHTSADTAYVVEDYPYGFRLRCKIRYWLEYHPRKGFRFVSQTTNPRRSESRSDVWNKPKASTYLSQAGVMGLNDRGHVTWTGLSEYADTHEYESFFKLYGHSLPEPARIHLRKLIASKKAYQAARGPNDPLSVGLVEAREAYKNG